MISMLEPNLVRGSGFSAEPHFMEFKNESKQILEKDLSSSNISDYSFNSW